MITFFKLCQEQIHICIIHYRIGSTSSRKWLSGWWHIFMSAVFADGLGFGTALQKLEQEILFVKVVSYLN